MLVALQGESIWKGEEVEEEKKEVEEKMGHREEEGPGELPRRKRWSMVVCSWKKVTHLMMELSDPKVTHLAHIFVAALNAPKK